MKVNEKTPVVFSSHNALQLSSKFRNFFGTILGDEIGLTGLKSGKIFLK